MTQKGSIDHLDIALVRLAKKLGLPNKLAHYLVKARRSLTHASEILYRRRKGYALIKKSEWRNFIDRESGYSTFTIDTFPKADAAITASLRIFEEKGGVKNLIKGKKSFFTNILDQNDVRQNPELLDLILSSEVIEAVTGYFGTLPRLKCLGLFISATNDLTESSQLFHVDNDDFRQIKCFINLIETAREQGPFTFLPAQHSAVALSRLGHTWGFGRFLDGDVTRVTDRSEIIELTGDPGAGAFVDTSRCLHFGSRARTGYRLVLMFNYMLVPDLKMNKGNFDLPGMPLFQFPSQRYSHDPIRKSLLGSK